MDQVVNGKQYTTDNHKAFSKNQLIQIKSVIKYQHPVFSFSFSSLWRKQKEGQTQE